MFAVIKTGGKQYRVAADDKLTIMRIAGEPGDVVTFGEVLTFADGSDVKIGAPLLDGVSVAGEIVAQTRGKKVIAFKKRRRKHSERKRGHRQDLTVVRITEFLTDGKKPAARAKAEKPAAAPAAADNSSIAAAAAAGVAAAKAAGLDTARFQKLKSAVGAADDLELIGGVGPTIAGKLNGVGVWHFWQVAAMSQDDIDAIEAEVGFKGRAARDEWKAQAIELMEGKGPRAKSDQERAAQE